MENEFFEVPEFENVDMIEPESEWLRKLEGKWEVQDFDFDDMLGY